MSIPLTHIMEDLQFAYVRAVIANAGRTCEKPERDYGVDLRVVDAGDTGKSYSDDDGVAFNCQLKSSTKYRVSNGTVYFPVKVKHYNKMVTWTGTTPLLLIAFTMPDKKEEWCTQSEESLCLRHCCFWKDLAGEAKSALNPESRINVEIPSHSIFDSAVVNEFVELYRQDKRS